jgi:hypothetical protein
MFISADQLVCHLVGDYVTQSHWMAIVKTQRFVPAALHACIYSLLFILFRPSIPAFLVILVSHFLIDRYRLARYLVWVKNWIAPWGYNLPWEMCTKTGYPSNLPDWLTVWLFIAADNVCHIVVNGLALKYL